MRLRTLVADDSIVFRRVLSDALGALPEVDVVGTASNGRQALQRIQELKPHVVTLDMEMPEMDGLGGLEALKKAGDTSSVIVVSALTRKGGQLTLKALERGAFDFITKPDTASADLSREAIQRELAPRLKALMHRHEIRDLLRGGPGRPASSATMVTATGRVSAGGATGCSKPVGGPSVAVASGASSAAGLENVAGRMNNLASFHRPEMVLVGVSTGGPNALAKVLPALPANLGVPVLVVQHMPPMFTQSLAENLAGKCPMAVREAAAGETARPNTVYIAPGGRQMRVSPASDGSKLLQITDDPPENNCRPAVDYLFRSAANHYPGRSMAVILTGMGSDGTVGLRLLKRHGCPVIAQDESTCVVYGMPKAAVEAKVVDWVLPLEAIAGRIVSTLRGGSA